MKIGCSICYQSGVFYHAVLLTLRYKEARPQRCAQTKAPYFSTTVGPRNKKPLLWIEISMDLLYSEALIS